MSSLPSFSLAGKRALVTGSTQGIGLALARGLASAGAKVILNGRGAAKLREAAAAFAKEGWETEMASFDVTNADEVAKGVAALTADGKPIDILVNNAGIQRRFSLLELPLEEWHKLIQTNLTSAFLVARAVAPGMVQRKQGKIVNICSLMSSLARPTTGGYAAAKGGLQMLTKTMCAEWAPLGLQANGIAPGYFLTELTQPLANDPKFDGWIKARTPANRWGKVEDLAGACVFLSSPASDFVNGQVLIVDGGLSAVI